MLCIAKPYLNNKVLPADWWTQVHATKIRLCRGKMGHLKVISLIFWASWLDLCSWVTSLYFEGVYLYWRVFEVFMAVMF